MFYSTTSVNITPFLSSRRLGNSFNKCWEAQEQWTTKPTSKGLFFSEDLRNAVWKLKITNNLYWKLMLVISSVQFSLPRLMKIIKYLNWDLIFWMKKEYRMDHNNKWNIQHLYFADISLIEWLISGGTFVLGHHQQDFVDVINLLVNVDDLVVKCRLSWSRNKSLILNDLESLALPLNLISSCQSWAGSSSWVFSPNNFLLR